jgi:hypothetical protein
LWKRVGDSWRSSPASVSQIAWQFWPSPPDALNTVASVAASRPLAAAASRPAASATRDGRVRRRSAGGKPAGGGNTVRALA